MNRAEAIEFAKEQQEIFGGRMGEFLKFVEDELSPTNASNTLNALDSVDLISRQAAIDALWKLRRTQQMIDATQAADLVMQGIFLAEKKIERLPSAQPEQRWIPATERLPEEPFGCIVSYHGFMLTPHGEIEYDAIYPEMLGYDGDGWNNSKGECVDNMIDVTAWMPLPEPYKEEA